MVRGENSEMVSDAYDIQDEWTIAVEDGGKVESGDVIGYLGEATVAAHHSGSIIGRICGTTDSCWSAEGSLGASN